MKKGLSSKQVIELIKNDPTGRYVRYNCEFTNKVNISNTNNQYMIIFGWKAEGRYHNRYICAFENDKLIYWGTVLEFNRHISPLFNQIGEEVAKQIKEYRPPTIKKQRLVN